MATNFSPTLTLTSFLSFRLSDVSPCFWSLDSVKGIGVDNLADAVSSCREMFFFCQEGDLYRGVLGVFLMGISSEGVVSRAFELLVDNGFEER